MFVDVFSDVEQCSRPPPRRPAASSSKSSHYRFTTPADPRCMAKENQRQRQRQRETERETEICREEWQWRGASDEARQCSPEYRTATGFERVALLGAWMDHSWSLVASSGLQCEARAPKRREGDVVDISLSKLHAAIRNAHGDANFQGRE